MSLLNKILRALVDVPLSPLRDYPPIVGVALTALATAVGMLLVFRYGSDQEKMAEVKRRIHACIFEIRLFNDDLRAIFRAQMEILRHNLSYIRLTIKPMLIMMVPIVLLIAQLQFHYGYKGLRPGEDAVLSVTLKDGGGASSERGDGAVKPALRLEAPPGLKVETAPVWVPSRSEMAWRVGAERPGDYQVRVVLDGRAWTKSVVVSRDLRRRSPLRLEPGLLNQILYPAEDPLPGDGALRSIELTYAEAEVELFGWRFHWLVWFFVLSIAFAFALKGVFGVTI